MTMESLPLILFQIEEEDELPDHFITLPHFSGISPTEETTGGLSLGVFDADTIKPLAHSATIAISAASSIQTGGSVSYQNLSGNDALVIMILEAVAAAGVADFKIWDSPTDNTATGTERFDTVSTGLPGLLNSAGARVTIGPIRISNNNYCVINPIANTSLKVSSSSIAAWVVERG